MAPRSSRATGATFDPHETPKRIRQATAHLEKHESGLPRETERAILDLADATRGTVSSSRTYTYLRTLPVVAAKIFGRDLIEAWPLTPERFPKGVRRLPPVERSSLKARWP